MPPGVLLSAKPIQRAPLKPLTMTYSEIAVVNGLKTVYWRIPCLQLWTSSLQQHFEYFTLIKIITQSFSLNMQ